MSYKSYFVNASDNAEATLLKLTKQSKSLLGVDGQDTLTGTSTNTPALGVEAWAKIHALEATVINELIEINPQTLASETLTAVSLAAGEEKIGYFTSIDLTSGSVLVNRIKGTESPSVPLLTKTSAAPNVADDKTLDIVFAVARASGGFPPATTEVWRKVNSDAYALLESVTDVNGVFSYTDDGLTVSDTHKYKARYANGTSKGSYSNEITVTPDLPVLTAGTGTWVHGTLTGGFTVTCPSGSLASDTIEIWGFANAAAVVADGALTLLASVHPSIDGATTYVYTKVYSGLDDSSDKTLKFQVRSKRTVSDVVTYGVRSAVLSVTAAD